MILCANANAIPLADESVHCCMFSPPYWGLRVYDGCPETDWADGWRGCLGLEPGVDLFIEHMMAVMSEVWRVLRADGTCWVNLGDSYGGGKMTEDTAGEGGHWSDLNGKKDRLCQQVKRKDLCLVPFRFALAAQAAGWWVRSDLIWSKPNPMPESCTDRPSRAHEYVFLLSKRARYFYDGEAIRENYAPASIERANYQVNKIGGSMETGQMQVASRGERTECPKPNASGRNARDVWSIPTQSYSGAHFATWPERLVERMILAGTSAKGVCEHCGAPWVRVIDKRFEAQEDVSPERGVRATESLDGSSGWAGSPRGATISKATGWRAGCDCADNCGSGRAVVLDPFCGSGTTVAVANRMGRCGVGLDISGKYLDEQARKRVAKDSAQRVLFSAGL